MEFRSPAARHQQVQRSSLRGLAGKGELVGPCYLGQRAAHHLLPFQQQARMHKPTRTKCRSGKRLRNLPQAARAFVCACGHALLITGIALQVKKTLFFWKELV